MIADPAIDRVVVTDTVPVFRIGPGRARDKIDVVPSAPLFAAAIRRLHDNTPLTDLMVF